MDKKGVSSVLTTVLLVAVVIIAVLVIWTVLMPVLRERSEFESPEFETGYEVPATGEERLPGETVPPVPPEDIGGLNRIPGREWRDVFREGLDFTGSQVQTRLIRGSQTIYFNVKEFEKRGLDVSEEVKSLGGTGAITGAAVSGDVVKIDIEQPEDEAFKLKISEAGVQVMDLQRYIVELVEQPILKTSRERQLKQEEKLEKEHAKAIEDLNERLNDQDVVSRFLRAVGIKETEDKIGQVKEFSKTFNGLAIKASPKQIQDLKESKYVKEVYPDVLVHADLMNAVPLVGANSVWEFDKEGGNCTLSGQECLDGRGMKIAILDTGVDYTHGDLGGCFGEECKVVDGWDFVNDDDDPMDDHGHGTHCAGIAAGDGDFIFGDQEECGENTFSFMISEHSWHEWDQEVTEKIVEIDVELDGRLLQYVPVLGGKWDHVSGEGSFNSVGTSNRGTLITSATQNIVINASSGERFFASWNSSNSSESYYLDANVYGGGYVEVFDLAAGSEICAELEVGGICQLSERVNLTVVSSDLIARVAEFSISEGGSFDKIFDVNNNKLDLPLSSELPTSEYEFEVRFASGKIAETHLFYWAEGEIQENTTENICGGEGTGLKGVAPKAEIYAYKVLNQDGSGRSSEIIEAIERAVDPDENGFFDDRVDVMSLSLGGGGDPDDPMSKAVDSAMDNGVVVVVAAGNSGPWKQSIGSPGTARKVITVGATYKKNYRGEYWRDENPKKDQITSFSSRGPVIWANGSLIKPDVVAPGALICSARYDNIFPEGEHDLYKPCFDDKHVQLAGTSMATPMVAGFAALARQAYPELDPAEIKSLIKLTSKDLKYGPNTQGTGRIDTLAMLNGSVILNGDLNFGQMQVGQTTAEKIIVIKNLKNSRVQINLTIEDAREEDQEGGFPAVTPSVSSFFIEPGAEQEIIFSLSVPIGKEGFFVGRVFLDDGNREYFEVYSFSKYSELALSIEGRHFPDFFAHNADMTEAYGVSQGWSFIGQSATLFVKSGNYTIYALNDFVNPEYPLSYPETDEYFLVKTTEVAFDSRVEEEFRLSDGRKFTVKARDFDNQPLKLIEWHKGIITYSNKYGFCENYHGYNESWCIDNPEGLFCEWDEEYHNCYERVFSRDYIDPIVGDREIYLSDKPDNGLSVDVVLKYMGVENE